MIGTMCAPEGKVRIMAYHSSGEIRVVGDIDPGQESKFFSFYPADVYFLAIDSDGRKVTGRGDPSPFMLKRLPRGAQERYG